MVSLTKFMLSATFALTLGAVALFASEPAGAQSAAMTFFVTSNGPGKGADLGGLAGADRQCQSLAEAAGSSGKTWHAYLSTQAADGRPAVNARDRIGKGPWQNVKGVVIAKDVTELHSAGNINKETALTEKGETVGGYGDKPNRHDVLTGSQSDGTAFSGPDDRTCKNWTSSTQGAAMVGHSDVNGPANVPNVKSWNAAHPSRGPDGGCSQADLKSTGGDGLLYCFAVN
ncbi:MAG: lectin [Bradyrhizobium sp.]|uniref:lectin n=1 Tax=Bradyrhizobium sp. TaxID=376 RepID=UPI0025C5B377|nr:lectin [Bradyrhizobium sp.]MBI5261739.1 lectin [Bradyrhizobium sp.]